MMQSGRLHRSFWATSISRCPAPVSRHHACIVSSTFQQKCDRHTSLLDLVLAFRTRPDLVRDFVCVIEPAACPVEARNQL